MEICNEESYIVESTIEMGKNKTLYVGRMLQLKSGNRAGKKALNSCLNNIIHKSVFFLNNFKSNFIHLMILFFSEII